GLVALGIVSHTLALVGTYGGGSPSLAIWGTKYGGHRLHPWHQIFMSENFGESFSFTFYPNTVSLYEDACKMFLCLGIYVMTFQNYQVSKFGWCLCKPPHGFLPKEP